MCRREGRWWVPLKANVDPEGAKGPDESVGASGRLLAAGQRFCLANGSLMQIVGYEGLAGPFAGPVGTHSLLGFGENIFRILMGVVRVVIRFLHLPDCRHDLGIDLRRFWLFGASNSVHSTRRRPWRIHSPWISPATKGCGNCISTPKPTAATSATGMSSTAISASKTTWLFSCVTPAVRR